MVKGLVLVVVLVGCGGDMVESDPDGAVGAVEMPCTSDDECPSGHCEGMGCGDTPAVCRPEEISCSRDSRPYCGCDGETFYGSGNCPGERYESAGEC